jgi:LPXTG-site transpeptidase (sortase) family protein
MNNCSESNINKTLFVIFKKINSVLFILIIMICFYIICAPYAPELSYMFNNKLRDRESFDITLVRLIKKQNEDKQATSVKSSLYIPSIGLETEIKELASIEDLHDSSWRRPLSSTPDKGGNTVVIAHRYTRKVGVEGPNTFYHLPKVKIGDNIFVYYSGELYTYKVYSTEVIDPENTEIENETSESILTLYTCTPLWSAAYRFVVRAKLIETID